MVASRAFLALIDKYRKLAGPAKRVAAVAFLVLAAGIISADRHLSVVLSDCLAAIAFLAGTGWTCCLVFVFHLPHSLAANCFAILRP